MGGREELCEKNTKTQEQCSQFRNDLQGLINTYQMDPEPSQENITARRKLQYFLVCYFLITCNRKISSRETQIIVSVFQMTEVN